MSTWRQLAAALLTGNRTVGGALPRVKFGDATCPGGTDVATYGPSLYLCAVWVPDGWFDKVKECLGGSTGGGLMALASAASAIMSGKGPSHSNYNDAL